MQAFIRLCLARICLLTFLVSAPMSAIAAEIGWDPLSIEFGLVSQGTTATRTLVLTNLGPGELTITGIEFTFNQMGAFGWSADVPKTLVPDQTLTVELTFAPTDISFFMADMWIYSNASNAPSLYMQLLGEGDFPAPIFGDTPFDYWAYAYIDALSASGITGGCGDGNYCPEDPVTRAQMAVFILRGIYGADFTPPPATGDVFVDVGAKDFAAPFIEKLAADKITGGCAPQTYCPNASITRAQMAVFLLRAMHGPAYVPPTGSGNLFNDVNLAYWAVDWIEQFSKEGVTSGCGDGNYCPDKPVLRAQMAVFLVRAFTLPILVPPLQFNWDEGNWDESLWE